MKNNRRNFICTFFSFIIVLAFLEYHNVVLFQLKTESRQPRLGNTYSDAYNVSQDLTEFATRMTNEQVRKNMEETKQPRLGNTYSDAYNVSQDLTKFAPRMTNEQARKTLELIKVMVKQLEKYNVSYFAHYGALLGISRHMGFIPWDDDFDISIDQNEAKLMIEALSKLNETHTLLTDRFKSLGVWKFFKRDGDRIGSYEFRYPFIDIIPRHEENQTLFQSDRFKDVWRKNDTFPLLKRLHNDLEVFTPCGMESILKTIFTNLSICVSSHLSHVTLTRFPVTSVACDVLKDTFPFTEREYIKERTMTKVIERLSFKNNTLKTVQYFIPHVCTDTFSYFDSKIQIL